MMQIRVLQLFLVVDLVHSRLGKKVSEYKHSWEFEFSKFSQKKVGLKFSHRRGVHNI